MFIIEIKKDENGQDKFYTGGVLNLKKLLDESEMKAMTCEIRIQLVNGKEYFVVVDPRDLVEIKQ